MRLLAAGVVAGVLVAFIALPGVGSVGLTARDAANDFQEMDAELNTSPPPEKTVVYDAKGEQIAVFFDKYRESVRLNQIAPIMQKAVIGIEDSRFYEHGALDLKGTLRALVNNASSDSTQGGSTLTQQYVKNLLVENARTEEEYREVTAPTVDRKIRELRYALRLEETMSKNQILEGYLNIAYFGGGAYGVQAAAKRWFSKPAKDLTLPEAALLAGITQNPSAYDPVQNPRDARKRRDTVLYRMAQLGMITKAQADAAAAQPIKLNEDKPVGGCETSKAPFFCEYVKYEMYQILSDGKYWELPKQRQAEIESKLRRGGYVIRTTLSMKAQNALDKAVRSRVSPTSNKVAVEAMVQPGTGHIKAIGQSKRFGAGPGKTSLNLAADMWHGGGVGVSAGSTFKTFTLAAALEKRIPIRTSIHSPSRTTVSGFTSCNGDGFPPWTVANSDPAENGPYNLKNGTWMSVNTFYAELEKRVGLCDAVKMAERFGMKQGNGKPLQQVPSQVLGVNDVDMVHLAAAYAGFAARGKYCEPVAVLDVVAPDGGKLKLPEKECKQVVAQNVADQVNEILKGVLTQGTARGNGIGRPAAGKTGTCEDFTCAVFAGHTPNMAAAVAYWDLRGPWKYKVYGVYGATIPAPIWAQSMRGALAGEPAPAFATPVGDFGDLADVPDVRGRPVPEAMAMLREAGFNPEVVPRPVRSNRPPGTVANTSPGPRQEVEPGAKIMIYVSNGRDREDRPDRPGRDDFPWPFGD
ncbi:penicillin-binding protein [Thermomonospora cellulosilytica]|uniref:Membrane peptidoglycan carboxypeptidase n=1 Tax=Thermomonospora cellulosilytica TaxID=1411118 RepID=A0A7W3R6Y8_9ACTN|nr:transglycosylase domain-containing protein [Thermomonospora cellulosilytica]MBA9002041.1 membrane peptidoglycan carboxypeptidase [Thermomonospora cellulosilytica]